VKKFLIDNNSDNLLLFFTGWGCDESEFEHLKSDYNVLLLYDYTDLNFNFDFSKYKKIDLISFSAGVFIASITNLDVKINKKIAVSGNPYLFDEKFGLSKEIQNVLSTVTEENADDFARNYLIKTDEEWQKFHHSKRTIDSCQAEFENLKNLYKKNKQNIRDIFDSAIIGLDDVIFNITAQKEFYGKRLKFVENARHNLFFKINKYEEILN